MEAGLPPLRHRTDRHWSPSGCSTGRSPSPPRTSTTSPLLDRIVERASAEGRGICLATGTGAHPPWLAKAYPEVTRTDFEGRRHRFGQRHNSCPSSPVFRRLSTELARRVARRYADTPAVHRLARRQRVRRRLLLRAVRGRLPDWLRHRYGTLDELNEAWYTTFWSHTFTDWDEIEPPSALTEHWRGPDHTAFQGITLDYLRFISDAMLDQLPRREGGHPASPARRCRSPRTSWACTGRSTTTAGRRIWTSSPGTTTRPTTRRPPGWR